MNTNFYENITNFLKKRTMEFIGLVLLILSVGTLISLITYSPTDPSFVYGAENTVIKNFFGIYGSFISDFLLQSFGLITFLLIGTTASWGYQLIATKTLSKLLFRMFYTVIYLIFGSTFIHIFFNNSYWLIDHGNSGFAGELAYKWIYKISPLIDSQYSGIFLGFCTLIFFHFSSYINFKKVIINFFNFVTTLFKRHNTKEPFNDKTINEIENDISILNSETKEKPQGSFSFEKEKIQETSNIKRFILPSIDLLEKKETKINAEEINKNRPNSAFMEKILLDFGIDGRIKKINNGPVVSLYEFEPAPGVKVSKVINLSEDLARNTSSTSARVSVIPGKNTVGIEIPNDEREPVSLREIISNDRFQKKEIKLPIALGKSISGLPIVGDLTSMPHLLIAGTTGSGKSVCINTIIVSLLYKLSPDICKFILIDPKMLELSSYEGIPHLLTPVITDAKKATSALGWTVKEMNNRYRLMSKVGVRNIDGYNSKFKLKMPYIVVVVDEMSDLMLVAGKEIENYIQKLSQMARAAGIHIIMATQRPSVDVITGTIKANFPTRVSFQVSSKIDSRTILGEQGAEQLLGKGDMLFMSSANRIIRIHGPYVSEKEIEQITSVLRGQGAPEFISEVTKIEKDETSEINDEEDDELYSKAIDIIKTEGKASTSFLQRKLQIGYNRAARIIDSMEEKGVISKANHVGKREVL
jgi:S-DNA-T family DNA segregation ATPase FtsK/SpoIIIE|tara:strand:- start:1646 stop:3742 length:2097 start_codon:yes stop_codon:yes gene_type:complete